MPLRLLGRRVVAAAACGDVSPSVVDNGLDCLAAGGNYGSFT